MDNITVSLNALLTALNDALSPLKVHEKNRVLETFVNHLDNECHVDRQEMFRILIELKEGKKQIVATRSVPYWYPEQMGENGLIWRDVRRR